MIRTDKLKGKLAEKGISQSEMAKLIGIVPKTFYEKMARGIFESDEIEVMNEIRKHYYQSPWIQGKAWIYGLFSFVRLPLIWAHSNTE